MDLCWNVGLYGDSVEGQWDTVHAMWQAYLLRAYASNKEYMHASGHGHIVHCSEFILR